MSLKFKMGDVILDVLSKSMSQQEKLKKVMKEIATNCLCVKHGEKVIIVTDEAYWKIAAVLRTECASITDNVYFFILEDFIPRPAKYVPEPILKALSIADVSVLWVGAHEGELITFRSPYLSVVNNSPKLRHAHVLGIDTEIICEAFSKNIARVQQLSHSVYNILHTAHKVHVTTDAGSDFEARFSPVYRWIEEGGVLKPEHWDNLPSGEVYTYPASLNGTIIANGVLGDFFCKIFGILQPEDYICIKVEDSFITETDSKNKKLLKMFRDVIAFEDNANRAGEFALGTNINLKGLKGHSLRDEKICGVHVAFGDGYAERTNCPYYCDSHLDVILRGASVTVDGRQIMKNDKFTF